jgi:hypothetical protein
MAIEDSPARSDQPRRVESERRERAGCLANKHFLGRP